MIQLDTNFLIRALTAGSEQDRRLSAWLSGGVDVAISSLVWAEFLCGPVAPDQLSAAQGMFPVVVPFDGVAAVKAAELYNSSGRRRGSMLDCMIAAVAIHAGARLATENASDFRRFETFGLHLAE